MAAYYQLIQRETNADQSQVIAHYQPTTHAQGAWNPHEQHMAPATGILCTELEQFSSNHDLRIARISLDIFGLIPFTEFTITTEVIRPGKTIELLESTMAANGRTCIVARAWRIQIQDSSNVAGLEDSAILQPEDYPAWQGMERWAGGFIQSIETRANPERRAGKGIVWINTPVAMVAGQNTSDFSHLMGLVDTANGIVPRQEGEFVWGFPNLDLQIHLHRLPQGQWLGLETVQQYGPDGTGLTSSVLHDCQGPFGRSEQILTLRKL
ncbi:thioesterase [Thiopseudomonas alkaliphila]|uniref:thioesterase family protein n=1 Tax=Thiopseudomonas alkaliphila TaxID=1697053 RepID=UPI00069E3AA5|nr:thioesterase family protein [Thiopseudomonas alkaliphila]AKX55156.1 thioesterase [Thiopseudomonas alkaliphila]